MSIAVKLAMWDFKPCKCLPGFARMIGFALILSPTLAFPSTIPRLHGTTFSGAQVDLPASLAGKVGVFVVGFTQASRDGITLWGKQLDLDFHNSATVVYFEMPVLASVPRILRGFVEGRIKSSVADRGKPHFLPITEEEPAWRALVQYADPDVPYILVVDQRGVVRWQTVGSPTDAICRALRQAVESASHPASD